MTNLHVYQYKENRDKALKELKAKGLKVRKKIAFNKLRDPLLVKDFIDNDKLCGELVNGIHKIKFKKLYKIVSKNGATNV